MIIKSLNLRNFRNIETLSLSPSQGINLFAGENAQGKSNILESLVLAVTGRSFRTLKDLQMIKWGEIKSHIETSVDDCGLESLITINLSSENILKRKTLFVDGKAVKKLSQFISKVDNIVFSRNDLFRISGEPFLRRAFLDRLISTINPEYLFELQRYHNILRQKNIVLKQYPIRYELVDILNFQLAEHGAKIIIDRSYIVKKLSEKSSTLYRELFGNSDILELEYISQNKQNLCEYKDLARFLRERFECVKKSEIDRKTSLEGIQRDDILIKINQRPMKIYGSQGQKRFASIVLKLAEGEVYNEIKNRRPIIFMDDCFSEIDALRRDYLWSYLSKQGQVFLTANETPQKNNYSLFIIKSGKVQTIV